MNCKQEKNSSRSKQKMVCIAGTVMILVLHNDCKREKVTSVKSKEILKLHYILVIKRFNKQPFLYLLIYLQVENMAFCL